MAEVSCAESTIGLVIPFILTDPAVSGATAVPISNSVSVTSVTWISNNGRRRGLTLSQPVSATWTYTVSIGDTRFPHIEEGRLEVRFGTNVFHTNTFTMNVYQLF